MTVASAAGAKPAAPTAGLGGLLTGAALDRRFAPRPRAGGQGTTARRRTRATIPGLTGGAISKMILAGQMPGAVPLSSWPITTRSRSSSPTPPSCAALPPGKVVRFGSDSTVIQNKVYKFLYLLDARPIITGEYLTDAKPNTSPLEGTIVEFQLNNEGGRRFQRETGKHVQRLHGDRARRHRDGRPAGHQQRHRHARPDHDGRAATSRTRRISSLVLKAGALPVPLKVAEVRNIGPSLGQDSIDNGLHGRHRSPSCSSSSS